MKLKLYKRYAPEPRPLGSEVKLTDILYERIDYFDGKSQYFISFVPRNVLSKKKKQRLLAIGSKFSWGLYHGWQCSSRTSTSVSFRTWIKCWCSKRTRMNFCILGKVIWIATANWKYKRFYHCVCNALHVQFNTFLDYYWISSLLDVYLHTGPF